MLSSVILLIYTSIFYFLSREKEDLLFNKFREKLFNFVIFYQLLYNLCCIYYVTMYVDSQIVPYNMYSKDGMKRWRSKYKI